MTYSELFKMIMQQRENGLTKTKRERMWNRIMQILKQKADDDNYSSGSNNNL